MMTRRHFLALGSTAAGLAALPQDVRSAPSDRALGIQLYTVAADLNANVPGTLKALHAIGYRFVESAGLAKLSAGDFRKALDAAGVQCPSCHLGFSAADPGPLFEQAHALGARYAVSSVLLPPGSSPDLAKALPALALDDFGKIADLANRIGEKAKQAGLQFAYHNHNFEFRDYGGGRTGYDVLLQRTDASLVKMELDCGWAAAAGQNPADLFKRHPGRFRMLHVKDFLLTGKPTYALMGPDRPTGTELGRGRVDYKPIFAAAQAAGVEYFFSEQEPPVTNMSAMDAAKVNYEYMRGL